MKNKKVTIIVIFVSALFVLLGIIVWLFAGKGYQASCPNGYLVTGSPMGQTTLTDNDIHMAYISSNLSDYTRSAGATLWITSPDSSELNGGDISLDVGESRHIDGLGTLILSDIDKRDIFTDNPRVTVCFMPDPGVKPNKQIVHKKSFE